MNLDYARATTTPPIPAAPGERYRSFSLAQARDYDREVSTLVPAYQGMLEVMVHFLHCQGIRGPVVDFGAGTGNLARQLLSLPVEVTLVDFSPAMCRVSAEKLADHDGRFDIRCHEIADGVEAATVAAAVTCTLTLHELSPANRQAALEVMQATLRPGGYLLVADYYRPESPECAAFVAERMRRFARDHHATSEDIEREITEHIENHNIPRLRADFSAIMESGLTNASTLAQQDGIVVWSARAT